MLNKTKIPGYLKDEKNGVVVNTNGESLRQAIAARNKSLELNKLKEELDDIKLMLQKLLDRGN